MGRRLDQDTLIGRGLDLHEARRYAAALPYFDHALALVPACPLAEYNKANTLHMLGREAEAEPLLRGLLAVGPDELRRCPVARPRSLQLDAHLLLFFGSPAHSVLAAPVPISWAVPATGYSLYRTLALGRSIWARPYSDRLIALIVATQRLHCHRPSLVPTRTSDDLPSIGGHVLAS